MQKRRPAVPAEPAGADAWQKTPYANLVRYVPSKKYLARIRVGGKLIRQSLKTTTLTVAKLRLADLEKAERLLAENATAVAGGKMTVQDALKTYRTRLHGDRSLKPRTKAYREECISKLLRTWPKLEELDVRQVNKTACLDWAARLGADACPSVFNHTVGTLKRILEVAVEAGALYDNPVRL